MAIAPSDLLPLAYASVGALVGALVTHFLAQTRARWDRDHLIQQEILKHLLELQSILQDLAQTLMTASPNGARKAYTKLYRWSQLHRNLLHTYSPRLTGLVDTLQESTRDSIRSFKGNQAEGEISGMQFQAMQVIKELEEWLFKIRYAPDRLKSVARKLRKQAQAAPEPSMQPVEEHNQFRTNLDKGLQQLAKPAPEAPEEPEEQP